MVVRKTLTLTTLLRLLPAASRTAERFLKTCLCVDEKEYFSTYRLNHHGLSYRAVLDGTLNHLAGGRVGTELARAVDHAIVDNGRGELRPGLGSLVGENSSSGRHFEVLIWRDWMKLSSIFC